MTITVSSVNQQAKTKPDGTDVGFLGQEAHHPQAGQPGNDWQDRVEWYLKAPLIADVLTTSQGNDSEGDKGEGQQGPNVNQVGKLV